MSIWHIWLKIKGLPDLLDRRGIYGSILLVLTSLICFFLGNMRSAAFSRPPITIRQIDMPMAPVSTEKEPAKAEMPALGKYVASKNGKKYYLPTCSGAKSILAANKIWFQTKEEAEKRGYSASATCKAL